MRRISKPVPIALVAFVCGLLDVQACLAGCGTGCNHRRMRADCVSALNAKGMPKGPARKAEFDKCMLDPIEYK
jgi:hypothetical protein